MFADCSSHPSIDLPLRLLESGAWGQLCATQFPSFTDQELIKPASSTGLHLTQSMRSLACWMFTEWALIEPGLSVPGHWAQKRLVPLSRGTVGFQRSACVLRSSLCIPSRRVSLAEQKVLPERRRFSTVGSRLGACTLIHPCPLGAHRLCNEHSRNF